MKYKSFLIVFMALCCLAIMAQQEKKHTIQRGETIESIAKKYDITVADLQKANPNLDKFFFVGMKINIPSKTLSESAKKEPIVLSKGNENIGLSEQKAGNEPESNEFTPLPAGNNRVDEQKNDTVVLAEKTISQKEEVSVVFSNPESIVDSSDLKEDTKVELNSSQISQVQNEMDTKSDELDSAIISVEDTKLLYKLIDDYVVSYKNGENTTPYQKKLIQRFMKCSATQQKSLLTNAYERLNCIQITEGNEVTKILLEKMALIDIYTLLSDENDPHFYDVSFEKGEICGLCTGDTVMLKECITELKLSNQQRTDKVNRYIATLQDYLYEIRSYIPLSQRLEGTWVAMNSVFRYKDGSLKSLPSYFSGPVRAYSFPNYILNFDNVKGKPRALLLGAYGICLNHTGELKSYAQHIIDLDKEKVYIDWASEKLNTPDPHVQSFALQATSEVSDVISTSLFGNSNSIGASLGSDLLSLTLTSLVGSLFSSPSKHITIVQCELKKISDYEMLGVFNNQIIIIKDGKQDIEQVREEVLLTRWDNIGNMYLIGVGTPQKDANTTYPFYPNEYDEKNYMSFFNRNKYLLKDEKCKKQIELVKKNKEGDCPKTLI